jgi:hypothetical protein
LHHSNSTIDNVPFFPAAQIQFEEQYNLQLHVAFIFYVMGVVWTGIACLAGLSAFVVGLMGAIVPVFTGVSFSSSTLLPQHVKYMNSQSYPTVSKHMSPNLLSDRHSRARPSCNHDEYRGECIGGICVWLVWLFGFDVDGVCAFDGEFGGVVFGSDRECCC